MIPPQTGWVAQWQSVPHVMGSGLFFLFLQSSPEARNRAGPSSPLQLRRRQREPRACPLQARPIPFLVLGRVLKEGEVREVLEKAIGVAPYGDANFSQSHG